jgi:NitT/TauT family transport system permease protein
MTTATMQQDATRGVRVWRMLRSPEVMLPTGLFVLFMSAWEIGGRRSDPILFAPPSRVARAFVDLSASGRLWTALGITLNSLIVGFVLSVIVGITVGVLFGRMPRTARVLEPYIDAIYATPRVVIIPLVILWFGVGYSGRLFIIWIGTVIPVILNTAIGVRNTRKDLLEVAVSFRASERDIVRHVVLPGAVPYVIAGLRIAAGRALIGVVIAEVFLDLTGVGGIITMESSYFRTAPMLAGVVIFAILGVVMVGGFGKLEDRFSVWKGH